MAANTTLTEEKEELRRQLAAGEYRTLIDIVLDRTGDLIQKMAGYHQPIPVWLSATFLFLITILAGIVAIVLFGEFSIRQESFGRVSPVFPVFSFIIAASSTVSMVGMNAFIGHIFTILGKNVLNRVESAVTLQEIQRWLATACDKRLLLIASVVWGIPAGLYGTSVVSAYLGDFPGFGTTLLTILFAIQSTVFVIFLFFVAFLSLRIRHFRLNLYVGDPSSSEVVGYLSGTLSHIVYFVAVYGAILTLGAVLLQLTTSFVIFIVLILWIPIVFIFVATQTSLATVIRRAKWRILGEIQARVERLQTEKNLTDKDTMETIVRLMDYHDRIKSTRNSALDPGAALNFLNSLLLPLLGFLLGNLDKILAFFF